jgi:hypothetical protein
VIGDHVYTTDYAGFDRALAGCQYVHDDGALCCYGPDKHMYRPSTAVRELIAVEPTDVKLPHLDPCVCTIDLRTGEVQDYHCGRDMDLATVGKKAPKPEFFDEVSHPRHYNSHPSGVESIEIKRHLSSDWSDAFKYVFRAELKNGKQDIEKALWYAKDGVVHNIPIHAPTWRFEQEQQLRKVIDAEAEVSLERRAFFANILHGNGSAAKSSIEIILNQYPS